MQLSIVGAVEAAGGQELGDAGGGGGAGSLRDPQHSPLVETALAFRPDHNLATLPEILAIARQVSAMFA